MAMMAASSPGTTFSGARAASVPVLAAGPPLERPAGARSGIGTVMLDAGLPLQGIVGDTMRKPPRGQAPAARSVDHGDTGAVEILPRDAVPMRMTGGIPAKTTKRHLAAVPGYAGHVEGKVAENLHGGTFRAENELTLRTLQSRELRRASSASSVPTISAPPFAGTAENVASMQRRHGATRGLDGVGLNVAPHVPGYMTHMPGKVSESIHGLTTSEACHKSQELRRFNPHVNCESWLRKGVWPSDKRPTYNFLNRCTQVDTQPLFSRQEDNAFTEDNRRLGHTFGLMPPRRDQHKPGGRYLHCFAPRVKEERIDPMSMPAAGQPTHSTLLEGERWKLHNALAIRNGNQRACT
eukprot:TRINITY_DN71217_c0_g1_i1.p2 TRINITY_DN71217_c0_g1~~TRINITY_DN71217_c0_g1_i1.p2  ORF type:complete len:352 (-),score=61.65 TRINITY_DN71217_c0_g1_i1:46-1101(-)